MSNTYRFDRMLDKIDELIEYEAREQIEYMIQDAFGAPSFDELTSENIEVLKGVIEDAIGESHTLSTLRYLVDTWEENNV